MKWFPAILLSCVTLAGKAQLNGTVSGKRLFELRDLKLTTVAELGRVDGEFSYGHGTVTYVYKFGPGNFYEHREFSCLGDYKLSQGMYKWARSRKLSLRVRGSGRLHFKVYKFDKFLFLIPDLQEKAFLHAFELRAQEVYKLKDANQDEGRYTDQFFIAFDLSRTYYTRLD